MKKYYSIFISYLLFFSILSCKKNDTNDNVISDPQLIAHLDSMLKAVGAGSYVDLLTGRLEGNFSFFSHYYPYDPNCATTSIPFKINTQLSGGVSLDTSNRYTLIDAGDLFINTIKIIADDKNRYVVEANSLNSNALDNIYGKINTIKIIKDGLSVLETNIYIPKNIVMKGIDCATGMFPDHSLKGGFKITWNMDYQNTNGVVIELLGKDATGIERYSYILVRDNGSYTFTDGNLSMYPKEKNPFGIDITLIRANFAILRGADNRRYNFNFVTTCGYLFRQ